MQKKPYDRRSVERALKTTGEWYRDLDNPNLVRAIQSKHRDVAYTPADDLFAYRTRNRDTVKVGDRIRPLFERNLIGRFVMSRLLVIPKDMPDAEHPETNVAWLEPLIPTARTGQEWLSDQQNGPRRLIGVSHDGLNRLMCIGLGEAATFVEDGIAFNPLLLQTRA